MIFILCRWKWNDGKAGYGNRFLVLVSVYLHHAFTTAADKQPAHPSTTPTRSIQWYMHAPKEPLTIYITIISIIIVCLRAKQKYIIPLA